MSSAGAVLMPAKNTGKFHGAIEPTTPSGLRHTSTRALSSSRSTSWGISMRANSRNQCAAPMHSPRALTSGLPCSRVRVPASASTFASIASPHASSAARRAASSRLQEGNAPFAAATAASSCAGVQSGASANTAPVAGSITPKLRSVGASAPPIVMRNPVRLADMSTSVRSLREPREARCLLGRAVALPAAGCSRNRDRDKREGGELALEPGLAQPSTRRVGTHEARSSAGPTRASLAGLPSGSSSTPNASRVATALS
jgi:hypothetical protein